MKPPCKKDGVPCPRRHTGCQSECGEYAAYRKCQDEENEKLRSRREAMAVLCNSGRAKAHYDWIKRYRK